MAKDERIEEPKKKAGGFGALQNSLRHVARQGAPLKSTVALWQVNQKKGFDCPGCAWPDPDGNEPMEFCENGVKAVAWETTGRRVDDDFFSRYTVSELSEKSDHWLEDQGRLTQPMKYNPATDKYETIGWDEAFNFIAKSLISLGSPDEAIFYTSGRTSNEAAFLYQLFGRLYGTNNFPDCSNMCHESSGVALTESIGIGKGTVLLSDFDEADAVLIVGQNPGTNHPRMLTTLQKAAKRGAKIVAINPLKEAALLGFAHPKKPLELLGASTSISTHYFQPLIGGDLALFHGIAKYIIEDRPETIDASFVEEHTAGFEELTDELRKLDWNTLIEESGLSKEHIKELGDLYCEARNVIICWAMGLTQHKHAVGTLHSIMNVLLLRGNIGRPGAGACPVRGHSNVQGDRTVGITERPVKTFLDALGKRFDFEPPRNHGFDVVGAIEAMAEGKAKVFIAMGGNFASATPDSVYTQQALRKCDLTVHVSTKLNRSHLVHGKAALILPCLGRTENDMTGGKWQQVTVEDSMSMVHASGGKAEPASRHLLSEPAIVAGIAKATLKKKRIDWDDLVSDYGNIRDCIADVLPAFENYNNKIRKPGGFHLHNSAREREWNTATGKATFFFDPVPKLALPEGQLRLMTIRSHDQFNTTIYGMDDRYRGVYGTRHVIFLNQEDMAGHNLGNGDIVSIRSYAEDGKTREIAGFRAVSYDLPRGCAAGYFPETNALVSVGSYADKSRTPVSKFIPITIRKADLL